MSLGKLCLRVYFPENPAFNKARHSSSLGLPYSRGCPEGTGTTEGEAVLWVLESWRRWNHCLPEMSLDVSWLLSYSRPLVFHYCPCHWLKLTGNQGRLANVLCKVQLPALQNRGEEGIKIDRKAGRSVRFNQASGQTKAYVRYFPQ